MCQVETYDSGKLIPSYSTHALSPARKYGTPYFVLVPCGGGSDISSSRESESCMWLRALWQQYKYALLMSACLHLKALLASI